MPQSFKSLSGYRKHDIGLDPTSCTKYRSAPGTADLGIMGGSLDAGGRTVCRGDRLPCPCRSGSVLAPTAAVGAEISDIVAVGDVHNRVPPPSGEVGLATLSRGSAVDQCAHLTSPKIRPGIKGATIRKTN